QTGRTSTLESNAALIEQALAADEGAKPHKLAQKYQGAEKLTGGQINDLEAAYSEYETEQRYNLAAEKARERLEQADAEDSTVTAAIAKTLTGKELNRRERRALERSAEGKKVLQDMQFDRSWQREAAAAESRNKDGTAEDPFEESEGIDRAEPSGISEQLAADNAAAVLDNTANAAEPVAKPVEAAVENVENPAAETADSAPAVEESAENAQSTRTVEEVAEGFGNQAGAVRELYEDGQDVDAFEAGVRAAWELGNSGIPMERAVSSQRTQGITEHQRKQAYLLGQGAARLAAQGKATANAKAATGGTVRRRGAVKGQGVSIQDLSKTFNDPQKSAYKLLSFYAEVTGVDVVLYKGKQEQETGRFAHGENTIYIDITAGTNGWDVTDLGAYTMMRTFSHEFVHFVEKWNPTAYNDLREAVFAEMERNGSDPEALVEIAMQEQGLTFDQASREVVAEALTDILPESQFVQTLAQKHKSLFDKLKERLEAFVSELKAHWKKLTGNNSREAVALKRQVGDALEYAEEIVQLFSRAAGEAVEAYQATVMGEEVPAAEVVTEEAEEADEGPDAAAEETPKPDWGELGRTIPDGLRKYNNKFGSKHPMSVLTIKGKDGDAVYAGSGFLIFRIDERLVNWPGFDGYTKRLMTTEQFDSFSGKGKPLTEQPMIGNNGKTRVAEFDTPDGKIFCNYDLLRYLDGNTLTYKKLGGGSAFQAADPTTGELVGVLMGMKVDEKNITDKKPGKMKSFGKAVQPKAQKTETPKQEPQTITDDRFTIESTKGGTVYVTFSGKPDAAIRDALKALGFKWAPKKKAWYGNVEVDPGAVADFLREVYKAEETLKAEEPVEAAPKQEQRPVEPDFDADPYGWAEYQLSDDMHYGPIDLGAYEANIQPVNYDDRLFFYRGTLHEYKSKNPVEVGERVYRTNLSEKREDVVKDMVRVLRKLEAYDKDAPKTKGSSPAAQEMEGDTPSEKLANAILSEYLSKDRVIDSMALYALADRAFGGTQGEGAYNRKDAYDALELAVNKHLLTFAKDMNGDALKAQQSVRKLEVLLRTLPTQTVRTQEQQDFQQFSTPPNIAYLAAWAGNVQPGEMVLEPSAGIGGIASFAKSWGAEVAVNELSERRLGILKSMGFDHVFNENAEQLDNVLPDNIKPTLVLMNPPFSSTAGRTKHNKTSNAERHIDQALQRLSDGGRLVAILGKGMNDADYRKYWDKVRKEYTIRANLSIDGSNYKKYGTTWGVQLVVIDKVGPQPGQTITGSHTDLTEVPAVLEEIRNDRKAVEGLGSGSGAAADSLARSDGRNGVSESGSPGGRVRDSGKPARSAGKRSDRSHEGGSGVRNHADDGGLRKPHQDSGRGKVGGDVRQDLRQDHRADHEPAVAGELARPEPQRARRLNEEPEQREDDGVYATFVLPDVPIPGGRKHPATLVESAAMSAVSMPRATYTPKLPAEVVKNNLSDAQMVTVTYAGQAHEQMLPDGSRKGFFIGDGTGVGKGRQIAGIILDNFMQGRTKAVWVSKNGDLYNDATRDWTGTTGRSKDEVLNHGKTKLGASIAADSGILFTTYPMLRSGKNNVTRLDQIVSWLGEDFDGVIAFDEAHNMGNLYGKKGKFGKAKGSEMAKAGVELQRKLPKARIVYVSATAATEVDNLAYAERLGLWGKGTAFANAQDFISKIGSSGLSAMELVVRDMKAMGSYVARSISYQGVAYDTIEHTLDENQTIIYNTMSSAWQTVMQNAHKALELTGGKNNSHARQLALGQFYSSMQRFYNQALTSMSMPSVIADMRRELAAGRSCVLQIVNTNEAQQSKALAQAKAENLELDDLDLTPRESLIGYLETCFPVQEFEEYTDEEGHTRSRPALDSKGQPIISRQAVAMRETLIEQVKSMAIPDGPMEMLFDAFGTEMVAENTGRSRRVVPKRQPDGSYKRVEERRTLNSRTADVQAF
ncbi:MAG: strawberry notch family protein, partial [Oscillospiraceae bacterium]|nr:strawberry notch family protein [Oscillospiraceae bacterium]